MYADHDRIRGRNPPFPEGILQLRSDFDSLRTGTIDADIVAMSLISEKTMRLGAILVGSFIVIALLPATALAYVGILWLRASERGWQTQVAAAALVVGWVALVVGSHGRP
jgi:hypothetical protein